MKPDETIGVIAQMDEDILQDTLRTIALQLWITGEQLEQSRRVDDEIDLLESLL